MLKNIKSNFWRNEGKNYTSNGELFYEVKQGDTLSLSTIAQDIMEARHLRENESTIMGYIIKENSIKKVDNDYPIQVGQKLNIGVLSKTHKPYILYQDVTMVVNTVIKDNISKSKNMNKVVWINKVRPKGEWDIKYKSNSRFYYSHFSGGKHSMFFYMSNWEYKSLKLLRYDDIGNINYGATGKYVGFALKILLKAGDVVSILQHSQIDDPRDQYAVEFGFKKY